MKKRVCLIVLDSVGIGALPDAHTFGDADAHTLAHIHQQKPGGLCLPNLYAMGLGNITGSGLPAVESPTAAYGRMAEVTAAKDTTSGHWELAGLIMPKPFRTFPNGFPPALLTKWLDAAARLGAVQAGCGYLGNTPASGTEIIQRYGEIHRQTGAPIVYTSADSVFQIAAHEAVIPLPKLYQLCACARALLVDDMLVGRVIARPFVGEPGHFTRTENRRDYAVPPTGPTLLDGLAERGQTTLGIGKIEDIYCKRGVTHVNHTTNNRDGIQATIQALQESTNDLIFTNLVDFDMLYGHRNDATGYGNALEYFDARLPEILAALRENDVLFLTADHGCDPTTPSTDHSREYVPLLVYGKHVAPVPLHTRASFADLGATVYAMLDHAVPPGHPWPVGESFLPLITR